MILAHYGENRLIAGLTRNLVADDSVRIGIGDDCAATGGRRARTWQLLKTDCIVEGVHFLPEAVPRKIGWKSLARPISDIAAMGGLPRHALVTMAISPTVEVRRVREIYAGIKKAADRFGVSIVGGETSRSPGPLFISIALTGIVEASRCVTRSGGRAGDLLYVTGRLGGSARGRHLDFIPRVAEARWLVENFRPHAMMDLSDGLGADLPRLARASGTGFEICEALLPCARGCTPRNAITDGEDYELVFAISARSAKRLEEKWRKKFPKLPLTRIGRLSGNLKFQISNFKFQNGFDHFA